jgi:hypothetical protein
MKSNKVFPDSLNTAVFTTKFIVQDKKEITYVSPSARSLKSGAGLVEVSLTSSGGKQGS